MTLQTMVQDEKFERLDPRMDSRMIAEQANRAASYLFQHVADRDARTRQVGDLVGQITERFAGYDKALAESRRRESEADEHSAGLEREISRIRDEHDADKAAAETAHVEEISAIRSAHASELMQMATSHATQLDAQRQRADEDAERVRDNVERLKEDLGRRFALLEASQREAESENAALREEKDSLLRSMTALITAVEAQARSLQAEEGSLGSIVETFASHRDRPGAAIGSDVIPFPQRAITLRVEATADTQLADLGRSAL